MSKYLFQATYTADGIKGLEKDKPSGRKTALSKAVEAAGGKLEAFYFALGDKDSILLADMPDHASAAAFSLAVSKSGLIRTTTTPLMGIEEADKALQIPIAFQAPGHFTEG
jgi:uncharacterized protein with GYD domain